MKKYKTAVICNKIQDYYWFLKEWGYSEDDYIFIPDSRHVMGRFYNGFQIVGEDKFSKIDWSVFCADDMYKEFSKLLKEERKRQDKIDELIWHVESHRRMNSIQECLDELDKKAKVLKWLIHNEHITKYRVKDMHWLTKERICELYRINPKEFE